MDGRRIGGVNVFGGGLGLYNSKGMLRRRHRRQRRHFLCRSQHRVAHTAHPEPGFRPDRRERQSADDNINYQGQGAGAEPANDFSHPICKIGGVDGVSAISANLPAVQKVQ